MDGAAGKFLFDPAGVPLYIWVRQPAGCDGYGMLSSVILKPCKSLLYLCRQQTQHTHAVFQLDVTVIALFFRKRPLCQDVPLVAGVDKMDAVLLIYFLLPLLNEVDHPAGIFPGKRFQRIQAVAKP